MPITKDSQASKKTKQDRDKQTLPIFLLLQDIRDCVCRKPAYHMRLSYRETHVYKVLYAIVYNISPHIQLKFFQRKKNSKGFWVHYTVNQKPDKKDHTKNQKQNKE